MKGWRLRFWVMFAVAALIFGCGGGGGGSESSGTGGSGGGGGGGTNPTPAAVPDISTQGSMDFGVALLGGYSEREIVLRNTSTVSTAPDLQVGQITLSGAATPFSIVSDRCSNTSIRSSGSCSFKLRMTPLQQIDYSDTLVIPSNDPDENPLNVALSGKGRNLNVAINEVMTDSCVALGRLKLLVSVTDAAGAPVVLPTNLPSTVFSLLENGAPKSIASIQNPFISPISVTLVLDYSGSLLQPSRELLKTAAKDFINTKLTANDEAAVIRFNEVICDDAGFQPIATGVAFLTNEIDKPYTCGPFDADGNPLGTALYDATFRAIENTAALGSKPRRAVIVLSDGADFSSTRTLAEVTNLAVLEGVPLFTIALLETNTPKPEIMQQMAQETGGQFFEAQDSAAVDAIYDAISIILSNQYLIEYATSSTGGGTVSVDVLVDDGLGNRGEDSKDAIGCL